jgi:hypothetical protein
MAKPTLLVQGMHGMGDSLHQRAVVRQLMKDNDIYLETSWPSIYHDLDIKLVKKAVALRTQTKNAARESENAKFSAPPASTTRAIRPRYAGSQVLSTKSKTVLEAMCLTCGVDFASADYSLYVPEAWGVEWRKSSAYAQWRESGKPLMVYRPLIMRTEWRGSGARNADPISYAKMLASIRDEFFVISVADLVPSREFIVGPKFEADVQFHEGQLTFETLATLFKDANVIFTSSGFAAILGPAVGTPVINIVGGYEHAGAHDTGNKFAPMFSVGPEPGCSCWSSACRQQCVKSFDTDKAIPKLRAFMERFSWWRPDLNAMPRDWALMHVLDGDPSVQAPPARLIGAPALPPDHDPNMPIANSRHPHHSLWLQMHRSTARKNAGPRA